MIRWLRVVLPSLSWLLAFAALYGSPNALLFYMEWYLGLRMPEIHVHVSRPALVGATVAYALWRGLAYHPHYRPAYAKWLTTTPWTHRQPLPLGPVHLVVQDVVLLAFVVLLARWSSDPWARYLPQLFLFVYLTLLGGSLFFAPAWPWGYAVAFGLGLLLCLWHRVPACLLVALLTYGVAYWGLRRSLAQFPWEAKWASDLGELLGKQASIERPAAETLGWPFGRLAPKLSGLDFYIPLHHALLISLLIGWWIFAAVSLIPPEEDRGKFMVLILMVILLLVPLARLSIYCSGYAPPINIWGRLLTGRWLIHRYDQVVVAPLLVPVVGLSCGVISRLLGLGPLLALPVIIIPSLFIILGMGPSLREWRLTGEHRIVEGGLKVGAVKVG